MDSSPTPGTRQDSPTPRALREKEGIAAQDDGCVVVAGWKGAAFERGEAHLALELGADQLGVPALLSDAHNLPLGQACAERRQEELRGPLFALGSLDDEPPQRLFGVLLLARACDLDPAKAEPGRHLPLHADPKFHVT